MNKLFISFEFSLVLRNLEFDQPCFGYYYGSEFRICELTHFEQNTNSHNLSIVGKTIAPVVTAPTHQQVTDWLREEHGIIIVVMPFLMEDNTITYEYTNYTDKEQDEIDHGDGPYENYYDALNAAIKSALSCI